MLESRYQVSKGTLLSMVVDPSAFPPKRPISAAAFDFDAVKELASTMSGDTGAAAIAEALRVNCALANLNLAGNPYSPEAKIGDAGAAAIASALRVNGALTTLNVQSNDLSEDSSKSKLREAVKRRPGFNLYV